jgi:hypothetical protein
MAAAWVGLGDAGIPRPAGTTGEGLRQSVKPVQHGRGLVMDGSNPLMQRGGTGVGGTISRVTLGSLGRVAGQRPFPVG